jgi:hypothetical protein
LVSLGAQRHRTRRSGKIDARRREREQLRLPDGLVEFSDEDHLQRDVLVVRSDQRAQLRRRIGRQPVRVVDDGEALGADGREAGQEIADGLSEGVVVDGGRRARMLRQHAELGGDRAQQLVDGRRRRREEHDQRARAVAIRELVTERRLAGARRTADGREARLLPARFRDLLQRSRVPTTIVRGGRYRGHRAGPPHCSGGISTSYI